MFLEYGAISSCSMVSVDSSIVRFQLVVESSTFLPAVLGMLGRLHSLARDVVLVLLFLSVSRSALRFNEG